MMSTVWEGLCNYIFCAVRTNMKLKAWQNLSNQKQALQADPSPESRGARGGTVSLNSPLTLCLLTPLPLPLDLATLFLIEQMASP